MIPWIGLDCTGVVYRGTLILTCPQYHMYTINMIDMKVKVYKRNIK
jgi:hypothetical protein